MTRALILAAGKGTRLRPLTNDRPKALVPLMGIPLIERQINTLRSEGVTEISIVGGYRAEMLGTLGVDVIQNEEYSTSNMVASMMKAQSFVARSDCDLLVSYGDIVYTRANLRAVMKGDGDISVMVDRAWRKLWGLRFSDPLSDAETLQIDDKGYIYELGKKTESYCQIEGQYTGLFKVDSSMTAAFSSAWNTQPAKIRANMYMTDFFQNLINSGWLLRPAWVEAGWLEIDTVEDLRAYENLAKEGRIAEFYEDL